jgi:hypothetical protein
MNGGFCHQRCPWLVDTSMRSALVSAISVDFCRVLFAGHRSLLQSIESFLEFNGRQGVISF